MQSVIQKKSYGSVKVFWLNKTLLTEKVKEAAHRLSQDNPKVKDIILFGSLVEDRATVSSDIDLLIIVTDSDKRFIDRPNEFLKYFYGLGVGVDLFVYTEEEIQKGIPIVEAALRKGCHIGNGSSDGSLLRG